MIRMRVLGTVAKSGQSYNKIRNSLIFLQKKYKKTPLFHIFIK